MFIQDLVHRAAWEFGDAPAIISGDRTVTFREFEERTCRLANAFLDMGLRPGDRVASVLPNCIEELLVYCSLPRAGLLRVGLNARDSAADHSFKVADSGARAFVTDDIEVEGDYEFRLTREDVDKLSQTGRPDWCDVVIQPHEPYRLAYTGGTTGRPKGVILPMRSLQTQVNNYLAEHVPGIQPGDVMLHAAPVSHASGSYFLPHLISGGVSVLLPKFRPDEFLEQLERTGARRTFLVPTMMNSLQHEPNVGDVDASNLVRLCYGASPITPTTARRSEEVFGQVLCQTFGQAEAPMTITLLTPEEHHRVGSAGRPYKMTAVRVVDEDDRELPPGETGEIICRGPIMMSGYWNREKETAETLRNGWVHTGDIGYQDAEGYVYLLDRRNDMIISGGFNVYPREVEDALTSHPAVVEAAVVSVADERWGEIVHAVLKLRPGAEVPTEAIDDYLKERLAGYKRPRGYHVRDELPKSAAGKILRRTLRDEIRAEQTG